MVVVIKDNKDDFDENEFRGNMALDLTKENLNISETRNERLLKDFVDYCQAHPELRFWQALRAWAGVGFVLIAKNLEDFKYPVVDTFYFEDKTK